MADDKPKKETTIAKEEKKATTEKRASFGKDFFDAVLGQIITTYVRPAVTQIPLPVLQVMKRVGLDKALPVISVALSTVFSKEKYKWGDKFGDFVAEASAETVRAINEKVDGKATDTVKAESRADSDALNQVLFGQDLDEVPNLIAAFTELFQDAAGNEKSEKEKKQVNSLIAGMDARDLYVFLKLPKADREKYMAVFIKKTKEKTTAQAIQEFKESIQASLAGVKMVHEELFKPVWDIVQPRITQAGSKTVELASAGAERSAEIASQTIRKKITDPTEPGSLQTWIDKRNKRNWLSKLLWR